MKKVYIEQSRKAFTLIEVIVAIGIFGLGVIAVLSYFVISTQFARFARQTTVASNLAERTIEESISLSYNSLTPVIGTRTTFTNDPASQYALYEKQVNVSLVNSGLAPSGTDVGLKKIEVWVYWPTSFGEKNVNLTTIVTAK